MVAVANNTPDTHVYSTVDGVHSAKPLYFFLERYTNSFINEMQEFVKAVQEDTTPPVTGVDGLAPVLIGMAAKKSYLEKRVVAVKEIS